MTNEGHGGKRCYRFVEDLTVRDLGFVRRAEKMRWDLWNINLILEVVYSTPSEVFIDLVAVKCTQNSSGSIYVYLSSRKSLKVYRRFVDHARNALSKKV